MDADLAMVSALRELLAMEAAVSLAILFGSRARGTARVDSDVDIAIAFEPGTTLSGELELGARLSRACPGELNVVPLASANPLLLFRIARDGVLLHERVAGLHDRFIERALLAHAEMEPLYRASLPRYLAAVASGKR